MNFLAHLLFPTSSNNYKAKLIKPSGLFGLLTVFLLVQFLLTSLTKNGLTLGDQVNFTPEQIIQETNKKRQEVGLPTLRTDDMLMLSARTKGQDMLNKDYWAHAGPNGETPWLFFTQNGYEYKYAGENLARDFDSASEAVEAWISSPTHRENLFSSKYQDIGVAVVEGDFNGKAIVIVVQHFGTRIGIIPPPELTKHIESAPITLAEFPKTQGIEMSAFDLKRNLSVGILGFLLSVLLVDAIVIYNSKAIRISGRNLAHFGFLASLVIFLILITKGNIL